jgi:hypothetical protein
MFGEISKDNLAVMFRLVYRGISEMPRPSHKAMCLCRRGMINASNLSPGSYVMTSLNALMFMLMESNAYDFVFLTLSALYRC